MKKTIHLKTYFNRAKIFGYLLLLILFGISLYLIYTSFVQ